MTPTVLPQYAQIKRRLISEIKSGRWTVGGAFPSEAQLLTRYKVSRATLVRSLQDLVREGYLYRRQGRGTFVADFRRRAGATMPLFISDKTYSLSGSARQVLLRILGGIEAALGPAHPGVTIRQVREGELDDETRRMISNIRPQVALVVEASFNPPLIEELRKNGCIIWCVNEPLDDGHCVYVDQERAGYLATKYLLDKGRRNIALLNGPVDAYWGFAARLRGYQKALKEAGVEMDPRRVREGGHIIDSEAGRTMFREIVETGAAVDGVVGVSDAKAMGAMALAQEMGRRIPDDLLVVSIDNTIADQASPPIASVHMPFDDVGRQAATKAQESLDEVDVNEDGTAAASVALHHIRLQPRLVERG